MSQNLKEIVDCLQAQFRWAVAYGLESEQAQELFESLCKIDPDCRWIVLDEVARGSLQIEWKRECPKTVVVDALHWQDASAVAGEIKRLLSSLAVERVLFLVSASLGSIEIPLFYGQGRQWHWGSSLNGRRGRDDGELLRFAHKLVPTYRLNDLILGPMTSLKFQEALSYIRTKTFCEQQWGFAKRHSRGHAVSLLFHGASGTGKTMAAEVLAAELSMPLYQVDLSSLVSKWVGETEKNLRAVFRAAEGVSGILLFDEGDALFGNRTEVKTVQDRYGNMEINYLLQEIERFSGVLVMSTNYANNMDPAFLRRFSYTITFGSPVKGQRLSIWSRNFPEELPLASDVNVSHLAEFGLSGGGIKNCIRHAAARAAAAGAKRVSQEDFLWAIKRELQKHDVELSRDIVGEEYWKKVAPEWEMQKVSAVRLRKLEESSPN